MQDDRSGLVVPLVLAAWVLGVGWAVISLDDDEPEPNAAVAGGNASPAASPVIEVIEEYDPPRLVAFREDGEYTGVMFDGKGRVTDEYSDEATAGSTALASRQVTVKGQPYFLLVDGMWAKLYMPAEHLELADN